MLRPTIDDCLADASWSQQCIKDFIAEDKTFDPSISDFCSRKNLMPDITGVGTEINLGKGTMLAEERYQGISSGMCCQKTPRNKETLHMMPSNPPHIDDLCGAHEPFITYLRPKAQEPHNSDRTEGQERRRYRRLRGIVSDSEQREHRREQACVHSNLFQVIFPCTRLAQSSCFG